MSVTLVKMGPGMTVTLSMYLEYWALQSYLDPIFTSVTLILGPYRKMLQSYLDPFVLNVTLISGPLKNLCYTHTVTPSWKILHSYLDPIIINVSFISGPPYTVRTIWTLMFFNCSNCCSLDLFSWILMKNRLIFSPFKYR